MYIHIYMYGIVTSIVMMMMMMMMEMMMMMMMMMMTMMMMAHQVNTFLSRGALGLSLLPNQNTAYPKYDFILMSFC